MLVFIYVAGMLILERVEEGACAAVTVAEKEQWKVSARARACVRCYTRARGRGLGRISPYCWS